MPVHVHIPTRIRVDPRALTERQADVEAALSAAAGRALVNARDLVLLQRGGYVGARARPVAITWSGDGLQQVPLSLRSTIEARVATVIAEAVKAAGLLDPPGEPAAHAPVPSERIVERFAADRFNALDGTYSVPAYQTPSQPGKVPAPLDVKTSGGLSEAEQKSLKPLLAALDKDDAYFELLLADIGQGGTLTDAQALSLRLLREFARTKPKKFRTLLEKATSARSADIAASLTRTEKDFFAKLDQHGMQVAAGTIRAAQEIPEAKTLVQQREAKTPGIQRLVGLVDALIAKRLELQAHLSASKEITETAVVDWLALIIQRLPRVSGLFMAIAGTERAKQLLPALEADLLENYRWLDMTLNRLGDIDTSLQLYRLFYAGAADQQEEVIVLTEARAVFLRHVAGNFLPTTGTIKALIKESNDLWSDWRGRAADRKLEKLQKGVVELQKIMSRVGYSAFGDYFREKDHEHNREVDKLRAEVRQLEQTVAGAGKGSRDETYLNDIRTIEQKLPPLVVRASLITFWRASLMVTENAGWHDIGSTDERGGWNKRADAVRAEVKAQYVNPDYTALGAKMEAWQKEFDAIVADIRRVAKKEFWINLGITVVAIVVTAGAGAYVAGARAGLFTVTLVEAGTFTAVTTIGQAVVLGKKVDPGVVIGNFAENVLLFGAFRVLNMGLLAGARHVAPGKTLTQLGIIFGANAVIGTGVPLLLTRLETGHWPEDISTFLATSLILNATMMLFTGPKLREGLMKLDAVEATMRQSVHNQAARIYTELQQMTVEMDALFQGGAMTEARLQSFQARTATLVPEFEQLLVRMAGSQFSDSALAKLGFTRAQLQEMARVAPEYAKLIAGIKWTPVTSVKGLPAPTDLPGTALVRTGANTWEYNPTLPGQQPSKLVPRLKAAGYEVTDAGGVLQLTGPKGGPPRLLLLPAGQPGAPAFPRTMLERATGWRPAGEVAAIEADLQRINTNIVKTLGAEFPDEAALATLGLLVEQRGKLQTFWPIDSVRGLGEMLRLELGISRATVRRLFVDLDSSKLSDLFGTFRSIIKNPDVRPGANLLVDAELSAARTVDLINAYDAVRKAGVQLPKDMSRQAVRGLLKLAQDNPTDFVAKLRDMPIDKRRARLEALSPQKDPTKLPTSPVEQLLRSHAQEVRPGVNLLQGTPEEAVKAVEALATKSGGRFSEPSVRAEFRSEIERYRQLLADLQAGSKVERNVIGQRQELLGVIMELERGGEVFAAGRLAKVRIDPALFDLPRSFKLKNAPKDVPVQLDSGTRAVDGRLVLTETTTGELSLPEALRGLDPKSGVPAGGTIDFAQLNPTNASDRKFIQMIKIRAAAKFATELGKAWGGATGEAATIKTPDMVINVSKASVQARRAAEALGFRVVETGK